MKLPRLPKIPKFRMPRPRKKLDARVRAASPSMAEDYDADEPQTKLSSAFIVVLLLHVVAVGGIYAFNSIKASRPPQESASPPQTQTTVKPNTTSPPPAAPASAAPAQHLTAAPAVAPVPATTTGPKHYAVKQGDTLTSIAKQFGVTIPELETANGLKPPSTLRIGQPLTIPAKGAVKLVAETARNDSAPKKPEDTASAAAAPRTYAVKSGDRLLFIAKRFNVSPDELIAMNKIKDPAKLQIGQTLKIPVKKTN